MVNILPSSERVHWRNLHWLHTIRNVFSHDASNDQLRSNNFRRRQLTSWHRSRHATPSRTNPRRGSDHHNILPTEVHAPLGAKIIHDYLRLYFPRRNRFHTNPCVVLLLHRTSTHGRFLRFGLRISAHVHPRNLSRNPHRTNGFSLPSERLLRNCRRIHCYITTRWHRSQLTTHQLILAIRVPLPDYLLHLAFNRSLNNLQIRHTVLLLSQWRQVARQTSIRRNLRRFFRRRNGKAVLQSNDSRYCRRLVITHR